MLQAADCRTPSPLKALSIAVAVVAAQLLLVAGAWSEDTRPKEMPYDTPGAIPQLDPSYKMESHKVVLITDQALSPRRVKLENGQLVAWVSCSWS